MNSDWNQSWFLQSFSSLWASFLVIYVYPLPLSQSPVSTTGITIILDFLYLFLSLPVILKCSLICCLLFLGYWTYLVKPTVINSHSQTSAESLWCSSDNFLYVSCLVCGLSPILTYHLQVHLQLRRCHIFLLSWGKPRRSCGLAQISVPSVDSFCRLFTTPHTFMRLEGKQ